MSAATTVRFIDKAFLDALSDEARLAPRLRKHFNLHANHAEPVQRLFNAIEPGSYVAPHRHATLPASENLFVLRGSLGLILFDDAGHVTSARVVEPAGACCGVELGANVWHSVVSLQTGTVILEVKQGPFIAETASERAAWAPADSSPEAKDWLERMKSILSVAE